MGLLKKYFGQNPEKLEQKGDSYFNNAVWGMAKIEYEKGLIPITVTRPLPIVTNKDEEKKE